MALLHQIIAIDKTTKADAAHTLAEALNRFNHPDLMTGQIRTYTPRADDGQRLPPEPRRIQYTATDIVNRITAALTRHFDVTYTKDVGNTQAIADIILNDGDTRHVIATNVPVTHLVWLEKQLNGWLDVIRRIPTLDPAVEWHLDPHSGAWTSDAVESIKTAKVPKVIERAAATPQHPAQTELYSLDEAIGTWSTTKLAAHWPANEVEALRARTVKLIEAVRVARETANQAHVTDQHIGAAIFGYLLPS